MPSSNKHAFHDFARIREWLPRRLQELRDACGMSLYAPKRCLANSALISYCFGRAGGAKAFDPAMDDPLTLPQAFDGRPESTLEQFKSAVAQARDGKIAVMTFHGVPDIMHPWVNTEPAKFESYLTHLDQEGCHVVALRDLAKYTLAAAVVQDAPKAQSETNGKDKAAPETKALPKPQSELMPGALKSARRRRRVDDGDFKD